MKRISVAGHEYTFNELSHKYHIKSATLRSRYYHGNRDVGLIHPLKSQMGRPKERTVINGKRYSLRELSDTTGIPYQTIYARYHHGVRGESLLVTAHYRPLPSVVDIDESSYTFERLSQESGIDVRTLRSRYHHGDRGERLIRPVKRQSGHAAKDVTIDGRAYSFPELSHRSGIKASTLYFRYRRGIRGKDLFSRSREHIYPAQRIWIGGRAFTINGLSQCYHLNPQTIRYRLGKGEQGPALVAPVRNQRTRVVWQGQEYSLRTLAHRCGIAYNTIYQRYYKGKRGDALVRPKQRGRTR